MELRMNREKYVCYYRVSTQKQKNSGLGLEAQKEVVTNYLNGCDWEIIGEYVEIESGKNNNRAELNKAIQACKLKDAKLIVSKLDRLSRDVHFITSLMKSDVKFVVAEMPEMTELTIHIFASIAQHERKMISERTKVALKQAKARNIKLGNPCLRRGERIVNSGDTINANKVRVTRANEYVSQMKPIILEIMSSGIVSLNGIANELNIQRYTTRRGSVWSAIAVKRVLER